MTSKQKKQLKLTNYQRTDKHKTTSFILIDGFSSPKQQRSSLLYKNRSLKQFFGNIPAIQQHLKGTQIYQNIAKQPKLIKIVKDDHKKCIPQKVKNIAGALEDEYLIAKKKNKIKNMQNNLQLKITEINTDIRLRRNSNEHKKQINRLGTHAKGESCFNFYDPSAYDWRKSLSKEKDNLKGKQKPQKQAKLAHSEYYTTNNTTDQQNSKKDKQLLQDNRRHRIHSRSNSSESHKKERKDSILKPKVSKYIFEPKSPKSKYLSLSKKDLLFTFGI